MVLTDSVEVNGFVNTERKWRRTQVRNIQSREEGGSPQPALTDETTTLD